MRRSGPWSSKVLRKSGSDNEDAERYLDPVAHVSKSNIFGGGTEKGPYSDTRSEGALEGLVGPVPPLKILGKSWPMWRRFE